MESFLDENFEWFRKNVLGTKKIKNVIEFVRIINGGEL